MYAYKQKIIKQAWPAFLSAACLHLQKTKIYEYKPLY